MPPQKNILITGVTGHLGAIVVASVAAAGHRVLALGRKPMASIPRTLRQAVGSYHSVDLRDEASTTQAVLAITAVEKQVDAAFLLAGGFSTGNLAESNTAQIDTQIALNFKTAYHVIRPLFADMCAKGRGHICLIGARPALEPATGSFALGYTIAKRMLFTLAESLAATGHPHGVRISVIVPGIIDTVANRTAMPDANFSDWVKPTVIADTLLSCIHAATNSKQATFLTLYHTP